MTRCGGSRYNRAPGRNHDCRTGYQATTGSVPANSETHFKVVIVSEAFDGRRKVARHQQVYAELSEQLAGPVHALALHTYTAAEWQQRNASAPASPDCLGGSKREQRGTGHA